MVRLPSRADRQDQSGCEVNDAFRPRPVVGEAFSPSRNGPVWTSNSDLEIPERVRFQAVGIGAVCGEHACVDGCPISARASRVHAGRVTWPQNDGLPSHSIWSSPSTTKAVSVWGWKSSQPQRSSSHSESKTSSQAPTGSPFMNLHRIRGHSGLMALMGFDRQESIAFPIVSVEVGEVDFVIRHPFLRAIRIAESPGQ